jgi:hypothetical protein
MTYRVVLDCYMVFVDDALNGNERKMSKLSMAR